MKAGRKGLIYFQWLMVSVIIVVATMLPLPADAVTTQIGMEVPMDTRLLSVEQDADRVTVVHHRSPSWRAVVDGAQGGVIRHFSIPSDGPNLVAGDPAELFQGLFNLFYMTMIEGSGDEDSRIKAKGTLWASTDGAALRLVSHSDQEVVVEATGTGFGWRLLGPGGEPIVTYRQTYTFRADRILCDGAVTWVYPYGTKMVTIEPETYLAPGVVAYPLRVTNDKKMEVELPITSSLGMQLPADCHYPLTFSINLKNGHRLQFQTLHLPSVFEKTRWYGFERPWQTGWAQGLGITGSTEIAGEAFPEGPVSYKYEMQIVTLPDAETPPLLVIDSPIRDSTYKLGETIRFSATATDGFGRPIPDENIQWEATVNGPDKTKRHTGANYLYVIPSTQEGVCGEWDNYNFVLAWVTATDAAGLKSQELTKITVDTGTAPPD